MNTYIPFCLILTNDTKSTKEGRQKERKRGRKAGRQVTRKKKEKRRNKFSKLTKKRGAEVIANKTCQQNFGTGEINK